LLQRRNLLNEYLGKKYIKVGVIEEKVGYKMKVSRFLIDGNMTYEKKLEIECVESE